MKSNFFRDQNRPCSSWTYFPSQDISLLAVLADADPAIQVSPQILEEVERELEKRKRPYRAWKTVGILSAKSKIETIK